MRAYAKAVLSGILAATLILVGCQSQPKVGGFYPGSIAIISPNSALTPMVFTATSQTQSVALPPSTYCTLSAIGNTLTTATFQVNVSNDGGTTYFAAAVSPYVGSATAATVLTTKTVTTNALFMFNCAGFDHIQIVTSGTFTATSLTINITTTSNSGPAPVG